MPQYLTPGVYIEEKAGAKPIEGVGTATGAFVGIAEKGPIGEAKLITNWTQFYDTFGGFVPYGYLAYAVNQFFTEGGTRCYVVRTCHHDGAYNKTAKSGTITLMDSSGEETIKVEVLSEGSWSDHMWIEIGNAKKDPANKFRMVVWNKGAEAETNEELTVTDTPGKINGISKYIKVTNMGSTTPSPGNRPVISGYSSGDLIVTALANKLTLSIIDEGNNKFKLEVKQTGITGAVDSYSSLDLSNVERKINGISKYIKVAVKATTPPVPPTAVTDAILPFYGMEGGTDGLGDGILLKDNGGADTLKVNAFREGVAVKVDDATSGPDKFKISVKFGTKGVVETFDELVMASVENDINGKSEYIEVIVVGTNRPDSTSDSSIPLGLTDYDFIGDEANRNALHAFDQVDDINILAIPDRPGDREVILAAYTYCKNRKDCFFVADTPMGLDPQGALSFKEGTGDFAGNAFNSSYGALYYPWIYISDPVTGGKKLVPPSGAVAGTYSNTDVLRGVHKAPAGIIDGYLDSAVGIEQVITKGEQELLNPEHINVIRSFSGAGIVIWGARTLSSDPEWRYINVRRLLLFIEESIEDGTQWVVFEPNDRSLWAMVKRDVSAFLSNVWRTGALFGATEDEAFFVKVDDENNPPEVRAAGQLIIDIGVAPVKPAEFVIFRIAQKTQATG